MNSEEELVLIFGALHLVAAALGALLLLLFLRSEETEGYSDPPDENEGGGGGNDRRPARPKPTPSPGGIPLPDAQPSRTRFRGPGRLADAHSRPARRTTPEPQRRPARTPVRR